MMPMVLVMEHLARMARALPENKMVNVAAGMR
jgi:hypothetical protein